MNQNDYYTAAATCRLCAQADACVDEARKLVARHADELSARAVGWAFPTYMVHLTTACRLYRAAGLGLLAGRVRWLSQRENVVDAWAKFDRLNAGGCGVA